MELYDSLASWWPLVSPVEDYEVEAAAQWRVMTASSQRRIGSLLELGCGGGNNAYYLRQRCDVVLTDLSAAMLDISRAINPDCDHRQGDMRTLRTGRMYDAVFIHDAVMYMRNEADLFAVMETARAHLSPGGVVLLCPDATRESWLPAAEHCVRRGGGRTLYYLDCASDPDPTDSETILDVVLVMREVDDRVRVAHDRHHHGLFPESTWMALLDRAGFAASRGHDADVSAVRFVGVAR